MIIVQVVIPVHAEQSDIRDGEVLVGRRLVSDIDPVLAGSAVQVGVEERVSQRFAFRLGKNGRLFAVFFILHVKQFYIREVTDFIRRSDDPGGIEQAGAQQRKHRAQDCDEFSFHVNLLFHCCPRLLFPVRCFLPVPFQVPFPALFPFLFLLYPASFSFL